MIKYNNRNEGQMIFKNIFEYNTKGLLNDNEFCELMRLIYCMRWDEDNYDPTNVSDKVKIIWQGIEPTFRKSKSNAEYYEKKQNTKTDETKPEDNKNDFKKNTNNYDSIITENIDDIRIIMNESQSGNYEGANKLLHQLFNKLGYKEDNEQTEYIINYITNELERQKKIMNSYKNILE